MKRSTALGLLSGAAAGAGSIARAVRASDTVRFAAIPIDGGVQALYAQTQGYFREAGIVSQIEWITNGGAIAAAVTGGAIDIGYSNFLTLAVGHERGLPFSVIAPAGLYSTKAPISTLMAPVDSTVKSAKDLNGKTVAVNGLKNITQLATQAWSDANGGDWQSVKFVEMPFAEMPAALATHRIDAAFVSEPVVSDAIRRNAAKTIAKPYDAIAPEFTISVWFVNRSWATANAALVKRVGAAIRQSSIWANGHDAQSALLLASVSKLPLAAIEGMTRSRFPEAMSAKGLQPIIDVAAKYGMLTKSFPAQEIIDPYAT